MIAKLYTENRYGGVQNSNHLTFWWVRPDFDVNYDVRYYNNDNSNDTFIHNYYQLVKKSRYERNSSKINDSEK